MLQPEDLPPTAASVHDDREYEQLGRELSELTTLNKGLRRQLEKALQTVSETQRAHAKMVATLTETMRENTSLTIERDLWRARAQRRAAELIVESEAEPAAIDVTVLAGQMSEDEINAIRKAMARLHHPDVGGDPERMKAWNAALDRLVRS